MPTLEWIGKSKVVNHHLQVPFRVLEEKYKFAAADGGGAKTGGVDGGAGTDGADSGADGNMIIHGDNLTALKSLLPRFEGRVRCIYIDPPYNTGNEGWVYNDNVNDPRIKKWLGEVVGKEGEDMTRHDKWLCMMYPRLKLLKRLLADDGAIFISIDDNEVFNLKLTCDEIFGANNYVDRITVIVKTEGRRYGSFAKTHENILVYARNIDRFVTNEIEIEGKKYQFTDADGGFNLKGLRNRNVRAFNSTNRPNLRYPFYVETEKTDNNGLYRVSTLPFENSVEVWAQTIDGIESVWRWGKEKSTAQTKDLCAYRGKDNVIRIFQKERKLTETAKTVWFDKNFTSIFGTKEIVRILGKAAFDFPKPSALIERILQIASDKDSIILDSFAGSGTTAHAVLNLNQYDGGNRKFILIEMMDYAETITAERVRRVITGRISNDGKIIISGTGGGFRFYELGDRLLDDDDNLNESVGLDKIREYVCFTETKNAPVKPPADDPYFLGEHYGTAYYFYYERDKATSLDWRFLRSLKHKAERLVIYADICAVSPKVLAARNITFKKIPRDIQKV